MKYLTIFLVMVVAFISCDEQKNDDNNKIIIQVCGETSPTWLVEEINSITQPVAPNYRPVSVYSIILNDITYVLITDMTNDTYAYQLRFFLCSGESIHYGTEEYNVLQQRYDANREEFTLLWSNIKN